MKGAFVELTRADLVLISALFYEGIPESEKYPNLTYVSETADTTYVEGVPHIQWFSEDEIDAIYTFLEPSDPDDEPEDDVEALLDKIDALQMIDY